MRIVHVTWSLGIGGIETMLVNIANAQANQGADVTIVIINDQVNDQLKRTISHKVDCFFIGRKSGSRSFLPVLKLNKILLQKHPDVIHCHLETVITIIAKPFRKRCCLTKHSTGSQGVPSAIILSKYYKVFAISNSVKRYLWEQCKVDAVVVENGIIPENFEKRRYHSLDSDRPVKIVMVGRLLTTIKGQDVLIKALSKLKNCVTLDIIGEGPDRVKLQCLAKDLSLSDKVCFLGAKTQQELYKLLKDYDIYVMASNVEGFGLTVAEAMAAKLPVIVSDIEGPKEIVRDGKYGHLFRVGDPDDCARVISQIIENYDIESSLEDAYRYVCDNYSVKRTAKDYLDNYIKV